MEAKPENGRSVISAENAAPPKPKQAKATSKSKRQGKTTANAAGAETTPGTVRPAREDIALRAYFISERRRSLGLPGDEHQDWIEAERQLMAERGAVAPVP